LAFVARAGLRPLRIVPFDCTLLPFIGCLPVALRFTPRTFTTLRWLLFGCCTDDVIPDVFPRVVCLPLAFARLVTLFAACTFAFTPLFDVDPFTRLLICHTLASSHCIGRCFTPFRYGCVALRCVTCYLIWFVPVFTLRLPLPYVTFAVRALLLHVVTFCLTL